MFPRPAVRALVLATVGTGLFFLGYGSAVFVSATAGAGIPPCTYSLSAQREDSCGLITGFALVSALTLITIGATMTIQGIIQSRLSARVGAFFKQSRAASVLALIPLPGIFFALFLDILRASLFSQVFYISIGAITTLLGLRQHSIVRSNATAEGLPGSETDAQDEDSMVP